MTVKLILERENYRSSTDCQVSKPCQPFRTLINTKDCNELHSYSLLRLLVCYYCFLSASINSATEQGVLTAENICCNGKQLQFQLLHPDCATSTKKENNKSNTMSLRSKIKQFVEEGKIIGMRLLQLRTLRQSINYQELCTQFKCFTFHFLTIIYQCVIMANFEKELVNFVIQ